MLYGQSSRLVEFHLSSRKSTIPSYHNFFGVGTTICRFQFVEVRQNIFIVVSSHFSNSQRNENYIFIQESIKSCLMYVKHAKFSFMDVRMFTHVLSEQDCTIDHLQQKGTDVPSPKILLWLTFLGSNVVP